jgi:hypothetical protein
MRHYATSRKVAGSIPEDIGFFNWSNPCSRTVVLGSTQPLTEISTRNLSGGIGLPTRKADLTAICEPIVQKIWEPRRLTTLWAFTACYGVRFTFFTSLLILWRNMTLFWATARQKLPKSRNYFAAQLTVFCSSLLLQLLRCASVLKTVVFLLYPISNVFLSLTWGCF